MESCTAAAPVALGEDVEYKAPHESLLSHNDDDDDKKDPGEEPVVVASKKTRSASKTSPKRKRLSLIDAEDPPPEEDIQMLCSGLQVLVVGTSGPAQNCTVKVHGHMHGWFISVLCFLNLILI